MSRVSLYLMFGWKMAIINSHDLPLTKVFFTFRILPTTYKELMSTWFTMQQEQVNIYLDTWIMIGQVIFMITRLHMATIFTLVPIPFFGRERRNTPFLFLQMRLSIEGILIVSLRIFFFRIYSLNMASLFINH